MKLLKPVELVDFVKPVNFMKQVIKVNKLAKARKMRKPPGTLSFKKIGLGKRWFEKVWAQKLRKIRKI